MFIFKGVVQIKMKTLFYCFLLLFSFSKAVLANGFIGKPEAIAMGPVWPPTSRAEILRFPIDYLPKSSEGILHLDYSVKCNAISFKPGEKPMFHGFTGQLSIGNRTLRVDLYEGGSSLEVSIAGVTDSSLVLAIDPNPICTLAHLSAKISNPEFLPAAPTDVAKIALQNSPYLVVRPDEYSNRYTDLPMDMVYRVYPGKKFGYTVIDYVIYFSDEDSGRSAATKSAAMGNYGRSSDIEWFYRIEFDSNWNPVSRIIQTSLYLGPIRLGIGHSFKKFKGEFVNSHPILYNSTLNNVPSDHPISTQQKKFKIVYQMVPRKRLNLMDAIESDLLELPWTFEVTQNEQFAEHKVAQAVGDHLFVLVEGQMNGVGPFGFATGMFKAEITTVDSNGETSSYDSETKGVSRTALQGDRWLRNSLLTAVLMPAEKATQIAAGAVSGTLSLKSIHAIHPRLSVRAIRVFHVVSYRSGEMKTEEITSLFQCHIDGINSKCIF